jgi:fatty-acyl-CoA synthase
MAALVTGAEFRLADFAAHVAARLPDYARPVFLRICNRIAATGTFKPQKQALARDGFNPSAISDALYVFDRSRAEFMRIDSGLYGCIQRGEMRL